MERSSVGDVQHLFIVSRAAHGDGQIPSPVVALDREVAMPEGRIGLVWNVGHLEDLHRWPTLLRSESLTPSLGGRPVAPSLAGLTCHPWRAVRARVNAAGRSLRSLHSPRLRARSLPSAVNRRDSLAKRCFASPLRG